jgi:DNA-binding MarR family transcriptional regulator
MPIHRIATLIMRWQDATQHYDILVGERLDLGFAERQCLTAIYQDPQPAGAIARAIGLTPAATTSVIDRLEKRGLVERKRDVKDRRKVLVGATPMAAKLVEPYHGALGAEGLELLAVYSPAELAAIEKFLTDALSLQQKHLDRLSKEAPPKESGIDQP